MGSWHEELKGKAMMLHHVSWSIGEGDSRQGGNKKSASWDDTKKLLDSALRSSGVITARIEGENQIGPQDLQGP